MKTFVVTFPIFNFVILHSNKLQTVKLSFSGFRSTLVLKQFYYKKNQVLQYKVNLKNKCCCFAVRFCLNVCLSD